MNQSISKYVKKQLKKRICNNKIPYKTKKIAYKQSFYFFIQYGWFNSPYKCKCCGLFHLSKKVTHQVSKEFIDDLAKWFGLHKNEMYKIIYNE